MKRALLFSGSLYPRADRPRYRNNLAAFDNLLVRHDQHDKQGFRVCVSDGGASNFDKDGQAKLYSPATQKPSSLHLGWLAQAGDTAVFIASNHGTPQGLCLWRGGSVVTPEELERAFFSYTAKKAFIFGQRHPGICARMRLSGVVLCCACGDAGTSTAMPYAKGTPEYDELLCHLRGALTDQSVDGIPIEAASSGMALYEACEYGRKKDRTMRTPFFPDGPPDRWARSGRL